MGSSRCKPRNQRYPPIERQTTPPMSRKKEQIHTQIDTNGTVIYFVRHFEYVVGNARLLKFERDGGCREEEEEEP